MYFRIVTMDSNFVPVNDKVSWEEEKEWRRENRRKDERFSRVEVLSLGVARRGPLGWRLPCVWDWKRWTSFRELA